MTHDTCATRPDGSFRWTRPLEWYSHADCDVWEGIEPKKPIHSFEIDYRSSRVRLHPDGRASIILKKVRNDDFGIFGSGSGMLRVKSEEALRREDYVVVSGIVSPETTAQVTDLISPMRDFAGWTFSGENLQEFLFPGLTGEAKTQLGDYFRLDDGRTRVAVCAERIFDSGRGWSILHWNDADQNFGGVSSFADIGCNSPAASAGERRANKAAEILIEALGAKDLVDRNYARVAHPAWP
ncbi:hypothetical protein [Novosphingobium indicum]|uniref:hypothetical protein n=1 Tax=Novosphingobium indicum TaxID=462949 RepID=UPI00166524F8|nr:hypothetical protein [Novosphingobium indicum]